MIKVFLTTNKTEFLSEFQDILKLFYPYFEHGLSGEEISICYDACDNLLLNSFGEFSKSFKKVKIAIKSTLNENYCYEKEVNLEVISPKHKENSNLKKVGKQLLYSMLSDISDIKLPYGSLTGIRPTKLFYDILSLGKSQKEAGEYLEQELFVTKRKVDLIAKVIRTQEGIYSKNPKTVDVFVNIPFCTSRCSYCSFICAEIGKIKKKVAPFCELLIDEIKTTKAIIRGQNLRVRAVYIGGGTPTSLSDEDFEAILAECDFNGGKCKISEFSVEAGRPDTITKEKLDIMAKCNVTRISVNPQSFNDKTLSKIGRSHDSKAVIDCFNLARKYSFDINMDLIAMLPDEDFADFKYSLDKTIELAPENITIHSLAIKAGSKLGEENYNNALQANVAEKMIDYALEKLQKCGYLPYYLYRLKNMSGNLENVGFCKSGKACVYNIDIMEETTSIIANGAGAISKVVFEDGGRIERLANPKGLEVYIERRKEIIDKKVAFFT